MVSVMDKDEYTPDVVDDVMRKLIPELALFAVDTDYNPGAISLPGPRPTHPFICESGRVTIVTDLYADVAAMVKGLTNCMAHSFIDEGGRGRKALRSRYCRMHPVVTDTLLAAHMLGGSEAVVSSLRIPKRPESYHAEVYDHWLGVLKAFKESVTLFERALAESTATGSKRSRKPQHMDLPAMCAQAEHVSTSIDLKIRPRTVRKKV